ncbi:MAG: hypothetical protein H6658_10395 [Ardenticatenaceae bacterium]|nr:hypothetical protein [Ardenticatenaceae bacterium]
MVHALELAHSWLRANGRLLDLHPNGEPAPVEVQLGDETYRAGWVSEEGDYASYHQANAAINQVVRQKLFAVERKTTVPVYTYGTTLADIQTYLAESWQDAHLDDLLVMRATDLLQSIITPQRVIITEMIRVWQLRPLPP